MFKLIAGFVPFIFSFVPVTVDYARRGSCHSLWYEIRDHYAWSFVIWSGNMRRAYQTWRADTHIDLVSVIGTAVVSGLAAMIVVSFTLASFAI